MTHDPPRLKDSAEMPRELGAAIDALRQGPGDAARVARVAARLGPLLDAPAPAEGSPALPRRVGPHTLKALRLFVAGMAVGASVLSLTRWQRHADNAAPTQPAARESAVRDEPPYPSSLAASARAERLTSPNPHESNLDDGARTPALTRPASAQVPGMALSRSGRNGTRPGGLGRAASSRVAPRAAQEGSGRGANPSAAHAAQAQTNASDNAGQPRSADAGAEAPPHPSVPHGEVELLFEARRLRHSTPQKALDLLNEHATRFAEGMLAPEREAMAIEILHVLGQTEQAAERLARYRARYPKSLHLRRLEIMR